MPIALMYSLKGLVKVLSLVRLYTLCLRLLLGLRSADFDGGCLHKEIRLRLSQVPDVSWTSPKVTTLPDPRSSQLICRRDRLVSVQNRLVESRAGPVGDVRLFAC